MSKWIVFAVMWVAGLFVGDVLADSGSTGSQMVFFGGIWMLACLAAKECVAGYQAFKARRKSLT